MKKLRGSSQYLTRHLMKEVEAPSQIDADGHKRPLFKRYDMKRMAKEALEAEEKSVTSSNMAKLMPVYSISTNVKYSKVWNQFFDHTRIKFGVNDVDRIKRIHVEEFMRSHMKHKVKLSTYKTYTAAMNKLEVAMNSVRNKPLYFSETLKKLRKEAGTKLDGKSPLRSYENPEAAIKNLNPKYQIAANLQLKCGARVYEITELKFDRNLLGVKNGFGMLRLTNTKGGLIRDVKVPVSLYKQLEEVAKAEGQFKVDYQLYTLSLRKEIWAIGEKWFGSHGLRWNYAQNRFMELQRNENKSFKEALQIVSHELGHSRLDITLHYLR